MRPVAKCDSLNMYIDVVYWKGDVFRVGVVEFLLDFGGHVKYVHVN